MNKLKIAINGFGRIGRNALRAFLEYQSDYPDIEIVAINDVADIDTLVHLLKYDSTHGKLSNIGVAANSDKAKLQLSFVGSCSTINIQFLQQKNPINLPWADLGVDVVLECTGQFRDYRSANLHRQAGARQVIIGAAPFDRVDECVVMGVNHSNLTKHIPIISSVSCTTQALVPLLWVLDNQFGVDDAMLTEIHAVTADQSVLDAAHRDLRRARASGYNIIPTTSSSISAAVKVLPQLQGKIEGYSVRVPTINVALIDVTVKLKQRQDLTNIKHYLKHACQQLPYIMDYTDEALVSSDFIHNRHSLIIDGGEICQIGDLTKIIAWYDNEWGYANRLLDMCSYLAKKCDK